MGDTTSVPRGTTQTSQTRASQTADVATWLTKAEAAEAIHCSTKAIERMAQEGLLQQARRAGMLGGAKLAVYHPQDVAREALKRQDSPLPAFLVRDPDVATNGNGHQASIGLAIATPELRRSGEELLMGLAVALRSMSETSQTLALFVTVPEAAAISGLSEAYLRRQIKAGTLPAEKDRGWKIRRKDLEAL